jgi:crotonobetainyl-CoA:carnitine CoA-transferase CaiB-like acyl-CoA transferase
MQPGRPSIPQRAQDPTAPGALDGVRVIDFTRVVAGPFGTQILADLGAEVIKIEHPGRGDDTRFTIPNPALGGESAFFLSLNRGKQSVAIDLASEAGRAVALDLIATADVLVENFTGSVMRRFQLDYPSLRERFPRLIYCSVSAYGRSGRNADAAGYDSPLTAEAGAMSLNAYAGQAPVLGGAPYTDLTTALNATIGILAALHARTRDGMGQQVDAAMFDSALANLSFKGYEFLASGREPAPYPRQSSMPRGQFDTADGGVTLSCVGDKMFRALCLQVVERPEWLEDPRYATAAERERHGEAFLDAFRAILRGEPSAVWSERCKRAGVPCGAIRTPGQALLSDEALERELVFDIPHPTAGTAPVIAQPFRLSATPARYRAPPLLAQHTGEVLRDLLGYAPERIEALAASGAIRLRDDSAPAAEAGA